MGRVRQKSISPQIKKKRKLLRRGIVHDAISGRDFRELNLIYACEQCTYFDENSTSCILGHNAKNHLEERQLKTYYNTGRMALCRNLEID
ncbi:MAG: hypothetical protein CL677_09695 [Bdellovibrionaceae bacterium]|nr:hypothetical protein [Pseudobdellovibrionaceae bacterium]|tara:strand:- start:2451 stop:2720 length:270 start_codon:yes stop_codon:yes gene_type:complete